MNQGRIILGKGNGTPAATSRAASIDPEQPDTNADRKQDLQLDAQEKAALGFSAAPVSLKPPPSAKVPPQLVKRALESSSGGSSANLSRAKRPKTIKFSPAKAQNRNGRALPSSRLTTTADHLHADEDHCVVCGHEGRLLICDSCNLGYHFCCLDPPIPPEETPKEAWHCKPCEAQQLPHQKHTQRFFGALLDRLDLEPPKTFTPLKSIIASFENLEATPNGEYKEPKAFRQAPKVNKAGFAEPTDPFRLKDAKSRWMFCYACKGTASAREQKRIVACDYCDNGWHLDCLDPPLAVLPYSQSRRKWLCPLHTAHDVTYVRKLRSERDDKVLKRNASDDGTVTVTVKTPDVPPRKPRANLVSWKTQFDRNLKYQVGEGSLILDYWAKVKEADQKTLNQRRLAKQLGEHADGEESDSSDLTSLDSSDSEDERESRPARHRTSKNKGPAPLDLSRLANTRSSTVAARTVKPHFSPLPADEQNTSGTPSVAGSEPDLHQPVASSSRVQLDDTPESTPSRPGAPGSALHRSGLSSDRVNRGEPAFTVQAAPQESVNDRSTRRMRHTNGARSTTQRSPVDQQDVAFEDGSNNKDARSSGKGRANGNEETETIRRPSSSQLKVRLSFPTKEREGSSSTDDRTVKRPRTDQEPPSGGQEEQPTHLDSVLSSRHSRSPLLNGETGTSAQPNGQSQLPSNNGSMPSGSPLIVQQPQQPLSGFQVQSTEHLKALLAARKILRDAGYADQQTNLFNFLFSDVPQIPQVQGTRRTPGWDVPWGS